MTEHIILKYCREGNLDKLREYSNQLNQQYNTGVKSSAYRFFNIATPLYVAVKNRKYECVKYILSQGADVNVGMDEGESYGENSDIGHDCYSTPLYEAIELKELELVKLLMEYEPDVSKGYEYSSDKGGGGGSDCTSAALNCGNYEIQKLFQKEQKEVECSSCGHIGCRKKIGMNDWNDRLTGEGWKELLCGIKRFPESPLIACCECSKWKRIKE